MAIKQRLGDLLVKDGLITEADLRTMLAQQRQHGGRLGEHLVRVNLCSEEQIAQALARQLNIPFNDMTDPPAPALSKLIPHDKATKFQALAMGNNPFAARLPVAFGDPTDMKATMEIEKIVGRPIQIQSGPALMVRRAIEAAYNSIDLRDEGTSEFQVTDVRGGARSVKVSSRMAQPAAEEDVAELSESDIEPIEDDAPPPQAAIPRRIAPVATAPARSDSGDEALRMVWAMADLLIERGYFTRAELMKKLRT
ncbi:MAG: hypothetical protein ABR567_19720 [Myxococcales bacterium]|nr:hypothetical protein [Myxococcales bacterium]